MNKIFSKFSLRIIFGFLFISLSTNYTFAGNKTWAGAVSTIWNVAGNWSGGVPHNGDDATIPTGLTNYPVITSGTFSIKGVKITGTGSLNISGGTLNVSKSLNEMIFVL